jgi:integrase/recombinase XerD
MFERILKDPNALARHQNGPFAEERRRYLTHCVAERMSCETLRGTANYLLIVANALHLAERPGELITQREIDAAAIRWVNRPRKRTKGIDTFTGHAVRWLTFLKRLQLPRVVQRPHADYVDQWADVRINRVDSGPWRQ